MRLPDLRALCCTTGGAGAIALHALYSPSITTASLAAGAAVMGATFAIPYQVLPYLPFPPQLLAAFCSSLLSPRTCRM